MENTITISVSDNLHELRQHGDSAFPFAAYFTNEYSHDVPWHWHEEYEFAVVSVGNVSVCAGTETLNLREGDGLFLNSGTLHAQSISQCSSVFLKDDIVFHGRLIYDSKYSVFWKKYIRPVTLGDSLPFVHLHADIDWQKNIIDLIKRAILLSRERPYGYEFLIREALSRIFLLLCENQTELQNDMIDNNISEMFHVKKMLGFIQQNYADPISLKDLASSVNLCEREVQRAFRNVIHQSPIQYLIHYRIEKACQLLCSGNQSIIEICNSCGFSSPSYFSKTFKQIMGCQPKEYSKSR